MGKQELWLLVTLLCHYLWVVAIGPQQLLVVVTYVPEVFGMVQTIQNPFICYGEGIQSILVWGYKSCGY